MAPRARKTEAPEPPQIQFAAPLGWHLIRSEDHADLVARATRGAEMGLKAAELSNIHQHHAQETLVHTLTAREAAHNEGIGRERKLIDENDKLRREIADWQRKDAENAAKKDERDAGLRSKELDLRAKEGELKEWTIRLQNLQRDVAPFLGGAAQLGFGMIMSKLGGNLPGGLPMGAPPVPGAGAPAPRSGPAPIGLSTVEIDRWRQSLALVLSSLSDGTIAKATGLLRAWLLRADVGAELAPMLEAPPATIRTFAAVAALGLTDQAAAHLRVLCAIGLTYAGQADPALRELAGAAFTEAGDGLQAFFVYTNAGNGAG